MPIYEYECPSCGHRMEAIQQLGAPALTDCPVCAKTDLRRLVSAAGFRLKGSGWYATDFKNNGSKDNSKDTSKDKQDNQKEQASPEAKSESAPASASPSASTSGTGGHGGGTCGCH